EIAFLHALLSRERLPHPREVAHVLVAHHERTIPERQPVLRHVGAAHARDLHLQQRGVVWDSRQIQLAQLRRRWSYLYRGQHFFGHTLRTECKLSRDAESMRSNVSALASPKLSAFGSQLSCVR